MIVYWSNNTGRQSLYCACIIGLLLLGKFSFAEEILNIEGGLITGNREQPKVLYIIPWQQPQGSANLERPITTQTVDVLTPIDRTVTLREIDYFQRLKNFQKATAQQKNTENLNIDLQSRN